MTDQQVQEGKSALVVAVEDALRELHGGPTLGAFGIARDDCALVHIDYFGGIETAIMALSQALATHRDVDIGLIFDEFGTRAEPCDCTSCIGPEAAAVAREKHAAAYTKMVPREVAERLAQALATAGHLAEIDTEHWTGDHSTALNEALRVLAEFRAVFPAGDGKQESFAHRAEEA